jgi:replication factor A1
MKKEEIKAISKTAVDDFAKHGVKIPAAEYEEHIRRLIEDFSVSPSMASIATKTFFANKFEIKVDGGFSSRTNPTVTVEEIDTDGAWVNAEVKCIEIWEAKSEKIKQTGLVGDSTGKTKFVIWESAEGVEPMALDVVYSIENAVVNEYQNRFSLSINKKSKVTKLGKTIEVASGEATIVGAIVSIQYLGSGIIKRCTECKRVLMNGICPTHGKNKGVQDLRIKAIIDTGKKTLNVIFGKDITEGLIKTPMEEIRKWKAEGDDYLFNDAADAALLGKYLEVVGYYAGDWFIADSLGHTPTVNTDEMSVLYDKIKQENKNFVGGQ